MQIFGYQPSFILLEAKLSLFWSIKSKSINHSSKSKGVVLHLPHSIHVQNSSLHVSCGLSPPLHQVILWFLCPTTCYAIVLRLIEFHILTDNCFYAFILLVDSSWALTWHVQTTIGCNLPLLSLAFSLSQMLLTILLSMFVIAEQTIIKICLLLLVAEKFTTKAEIEPAVEISFMTCSIINASLTDFMNIHGE